MTMYLLYLIYYQLVPCLYAFYRAKKRRTLSKLRRIVACVAATAVMFVVSVPIALYNLYLPSVVAPVLGGVLSIFTSEWVYKEVRFR